MLSTITLSFAAGAVYQRRSELWSGLAAQSVTAKEVEHVKELFRAELYEETIAACLEFEKGRSDSREVPKVIYIRWLSCRRSNQPAAAEAAYKLFVDRYPGDPLVADLRYARAMDFIAANKFEAADVELNAAKRNFPTSEVSRTAAVVQREVVWPKIVMSR